jgi:uncharacterized membrane protein YkvA (DUF1232 family)
MNFIRSTWQETSFMEKLALVGSLAYFILPIDLIPELMFGVFGIADDIAALALLFSTVLRVRNRINEKERQKSLPTTR